MRGPARTPVWPTALAVAGALGAGLLYAGLVRQPLGVLPYGTVLLPALLSGLLAFCAVNLLPDRLLHSEMTCLRRAFRRRHGLSEARTRYVFAAMGDAIRQARALDALAAQLAPELAERVREAVALLARIEAEIAAEPEASGALQELLVRSEPVVETLQRFVRFKRRQGGGDAGLDEAHARVGDALTAFETAGRAVIAARAKNRADGIGIASRTAQTALRRRPEAFDLPAPPGAAGEAQSDTRGAAAPSINRSGTT